MDSQENLKFKMRFLAVLECLVLIHLIKCQDLNDTTNNNSTEEGPALRNVTKLQYDYETVVSKMSKLRQDLMQNYPDYGDGSNLSPPPKGSELVNDRGVFKMITNIITFLGVSRIIEMDVDQQALTLIVDEYYSWTDESLIWNDTDASKALGLNVMLLNTSQIWMPDFAYGNVLQSSVLTDESFVVNYKDGYVALEQSSQITIPCAVNIHDFPFDIHNCSFYVNGRQDFSRLKFQDSVYTWFGKNNYSHLEWNILDVYTKVYNYSYRVSITVQREGRFYAVVLLFPLTLLNLLSLVIFTLPINTTERESFALTLILTYFVFIMIVIDSSPPTGEQIPLLGLYIIICTGLMVLSFGLSLILIEINEHCTVKKRKMPKCFDYLVGKFCCLKGFYNLKYQRKYAEKLRETQSDKEKEATEDLVENNNQEEAYLDFEKFKTFDEYQGYKWKIFTNGLNFIFFLLVLCTHITIPLVLFLHQQS